MRRSLRVATLMAGLIGAAGVACHPNLWPPADPVISGPSRGTVDSVLTFWLGTADWDKSADSVRFRVSWGDGDTLGWGPLVAGAVLWQNYRTEHVWHVAGQYQVTAQAQDQHGLSGGWCSPSTVTIVGSARGSHQPNHAEAFSEEQWLP